MATQQPEGHHPSSIRTFVGQVLQVGLREWRRLLKDSRLRSVVLIAPFLYASLFCAVYIHGTVEDLPIAVARLDDSQLARTLVRMLDASPKLRVQHYAHSVAEVQDLLYSRQVVAAIVIPRDFTVRLKRGGDSFVTAYVDAASMVKANTAGTAINTVVQTLSAGVEIRSLMKKGASRDAAKASFMPIKLDLRTLHNPTFSYAAFMVPGILIAILQQVILLGLALAWTSEKEGNTLAELFKISTNPWALMFGKSLPYLLINLVVAEFYLRVLFPLSSIPMQGHWPTMMAFTFLFILVVVSWGLWVSALCKTRLFATQILMFVAMPSFVLSGFTWPLSAMPSGIQRFSQLLPMTHFVENFRSIYLAGVPFHYVLPGFYVLGLFLLVNTVLAYAAVRRIVKTNLVPS